MGASFVASVARLKDPGLNGDCLCTSQAVRHSFDLLSTLSCLSIPFLVLFLYVSLLMDSNWL